MEKKIEWGYPVNIKNLEGYLEVLKNAYQDLQKATQQVRMSHDASRIVWVLPVCYNRSNEELEIDGTRDEFAYITPQGEILKTAEHNKNAVEMGGLIHILEHCITNRKYERDLGRAMCKSAFFGML